MPVFLSMALKYLPLIVSAVKSASEMIDKYNQLLEKLHRENRAPTPKEMVEFAEMRHAAVENYMEALREAQKELEEE